MGAIFIQATGTIGASELYNNRAQRGGVLFVSGRPDQAGRGTSQSSVFRNNRANGDGGALWLSSASSFVSQSNVYSGNMAMQGYVQVAHVQHVSRMLQPAPAVDTRPLT